MSATIPVFLLYFATLQTCHSLYLLGRYFLSSFHLHFTAYLGLHF
jgi:hypothetical protein